MNPLLISALVAAIVSGLASGTLVYKYEESKINAKEKERVQLLLTQEQELHKFDNHRATVAAAATRDGVVRSAKLRSDADGARSVLSGLRIATDAALLAASTDLAACVNTSATLGELFTASSERYTEMAATAGRHASDVETLTAAWPR